MELTEKERYIVFQLENDKKADILSELSEECSHTTDREKQDSILFLMNKLSSLSETECMELVRDVQENYGIPQKAGAPGAMSFCMRSEERESNLSGHGIMALERFDPKVHHMVVFDVLSENSRMGWLGEKTRLFLTDEGYQKSLDEQKRGLIRIKSHARVFKGYLD